MSLLGGLGKIAKAVLRSPVAKLVPGLNVASTIYTAGSALNYGRKALGIGTALPKTASPILNSSGMPMLQAGGLPALPGAGAVGGAIVGGARALARNPTVQRWTRRAAAAANLLVVGSIVYDAAGNAVGRIQRKRTVIDVTALRRAAGRLEQFQRLQKRVDRSLPHRPQRRQCKPQLQPRCH